MFVFKKKLIEQKNRAAEDLRMNEAGLSMQPLFCVVVILALIAFFMGTR